MMVFRAEHIQPILDGTKTQTRRLWKTARVKAGGLHKCYSGGLPLSKCHECLGTGKVPHSDDVNSLSFVWQPCPYCHGTGKLQPFATVRIKRVWQEPFGGLSVADARAEGYQSVSDYLTAFYLIYGLLDTKKLTPPTWWVVEFELVDSAA